MKAALTILIIVVLGLGAALWFQDRTVGTRLALAETGVMRWSNQWYQSQETLNVTAQTSARYNSTILMRDTQLNMTSNELVRTTNALAECTKLVGQMQSELEGASSELWERDSQLIATRKRLEQVEQTLTNQLTSNRDLEARLASLNQQLAATNAQRARFEQEIKALQAQVADLGKAFQQATNVVQQATTRLSASEETVLQQDKILAALKLERQLMITRTEELEKERAQLLAQWNNRAALQAQLEKLSQ